MAKLLYMLFLCVLSFYFFGTFFSQFTIPKSQTMANRKWPFRTTENDAQQFSFVYFYLSDGTASDWLAEREEVAGQINHKRA